jgi:hypothetical protein
MRGRHLTPDPPKPCRRSPLFDGCHPPTPVGRPDGVRAATACDVEGGPGHQRRRLGHEDGVRMDRLDDPRARALVAVEVTFVTHRGARMRARSRHLRVGSGSPPDARTSPPPGQARLAPERRPAVEWPRRPAPWMPPLRERPAPGRPGRRRGTIPWQASGHRSAAMRAPTHVGARDGSARWRLAGRRARQPSAG